MSENSIIFTHVHEARKANLHAYKRITIRPAIYERGPFPYREPTTVYAIGEKKPEKKIQGFNGIRIRDLREYRCDALPTEKLSYEATHWKPGHFREFYIFHEGNRWKNKYSTLGWTF